MISSWASEQAEMLDGGYGEEAGEDGEDGLRTGPQHTSKRPSKYSAVKYGEEGGGSSKLKARLPSSNAATDDSAYGPSQSMDDDEDRAGRPSSAELDGQPVRGLPGAQEGLSFEYLIERELQRTQNALGERSPQRSERRRSERSPQQRAVSRPFLRRGEGLIARFGPNAVGLSPSSASAPTNSTATPRPRPSRNVAPPEAWAEDAGAPQPQPHHTGDARHRRVLPATDGGGRARRDPHAFLGGAAAGTQQFDDEGPWADTASETSHARWERTKESEEQELEEFRILEQAAVFLPTSPSQSASSSRHSYNGGEEDEPGAMGRRRAPSPRGDRQAPALLLGRELAPGPAAPAFDDFDDFQPWDTAAEDDDDAAGTAGLRRLQQQAASTRAPRGGRRAEPDSDTAWEELDNEGVDGDGEDNEEARLERSGGRGVARRSARSSRAGSVTPTRELSPPRSALVHKLFPATRSSAGSRRGASSKAAASRNTRATGGDSTARQQGRSSTGKPARSNRKSKPRTPARQAQPELDDYQGLQSAVSPEVSGVVSAKLAELDEEILRFKEGNRRLARAQEERARLITGLRNDMKEFEQRKEAELQRIEDHVAEETKKLKRDRRVFETYRHQAKNMPSKEQRNELEELRAEVKALKTELQLKDKRASSAATRHKDKLQVLTERVAELEAEVAAHEQARLSHWERRPPRQSSSPGRPTSSRAGPRRTRSRASPHATGSLVMEAADVQDSPGRPVSTSLPDDMQKAQRRAVHARAASVASELVANSNDFVPFDDFSVRESMLKDSVVGHLQSTIDPEDSKTEHFLDNGNKLIKFSNGTRKEVAPDGNIVVNFFNGDVKQIHPNGQVVYHYSTAATTHTTHPDGLEVLQFANGQVEKHYPDGNQEILFPDNTVKYILANGEEETVFPDQTVQRLTSAGERIIKFPNGQVEVHTADYKKRRYPDGTEKIVFPDGRQRTNYASGRVRIKDQHGVVILDQTPGPI